MKKYILILFLSITISLNAQVCLDVHLVIQEQTQWCWAASAKCVLDYYGNEYLQCEIADYNRNNCPWGNYGSTDCCVNALWGCNAPAYLECLQDILLNLGNITNAPANNPLALDGINFHLGRQRPIIMRWQKISAPTHGHIMVIYGVDGYKIEYMDPDPATGGYRVLPYDSLKNNGTYEWTQTITLQKSPFPDHCYNCKFDANKGEKAMDCGGPCPPCEYAPQQVIINTATNNLPSDVRAINKITVGNAAVKVLSGQDVTFTTAGDIELLPGFEIDAGANFNTQLQDDPMSLTQICGKFCKEDTYGPIVAYRYKDIFRGYDIVNVDRIVYEITDIQSGRPVYKNIVYVSDYGTVDLWDLIEGAHLGQITYYAALIGIFPCNGGLGNEGVVRFMVYDLDKSLNSEQETEETETSAPFLSPSNNPAPQIEKQTDNFFIIPNPNSGTFQIEPNFPLSDIAHLKVVDVMGTTVYETHNVTSNTIQLQTPAQGQFFVVVFLKEGGMITKKMLIQR